jgi:hypothetical protein
MAEEELLRVLIQLMGRSAFPEDDLREIVATSDKYLKAYNMCDGTKTQAEVGKAVKVDAGNLSRTVARWVEEGVMFRLGEGREAHLLHLYPIAATPRKRRSQST